VYEATLAWIEASSLAQGARSSTWLYPVANLVHVLGAALLVGSIAVFDIMLLRGRLDLAVGVSRIALPVAASGIVMLVASGPVLFSAEATAIGRNPVFLAKMAFILIGLANLAIYHLAARRDRLAIPPSARVHAGVSLAVWVSVLLAGRSIAYY
jgi:hypothetical protein